MTKLFNNRYRISSARLQTWNYANAGMYFITICTANRNCYFGHCDDGIIQLSGIGKIAEIEWVKSIELRPDMNLELGEFVVMPNHFHGIMMIGENEYNNGLDELDGRGAGRDEMHRVSTNKPQNKFAPQSKNLASVIRGYKSAVTTYARKNKIEFAWQARFHDHVIRSPNEFERISEYIRNNPAKWMEDRFYKEDD